MIRNGSTAGSLAVVLALVCAVSTAAQENPPTQPRAEAGLQPQHEAQPQPGDDRPERHRREPRVHDPSTIVKDKDEYWIFTTGRGVGSLRSKDLVHWQPGPPVFADPPDWITDVVPKQRGYFWAPDVIQLGDRFLVYYSVSAFGKQTSAIALASSRALDPDDPDYYWTDHGIVIRSEEGSQYNAIDPGIVCTGDGKLWMAFGSFWSGIHLVELDGETGLRIAADSPIYPLAQKEQIEAAVICERDGYYYLFLNWGWCCRGVRSTYNVRVGRSREITGPYLDKGGVDMKDGGGTLVLDTEEEFIGPGHPGIFRDGERYLMSYHYYDRDRNGRPALAIRELEWTDDGWPRVTAERITPVAE